MCCQYLKFFNSVSFIVWKLWLRQKLKPKLTKGNNTPNYICWLLVINIFSNNDYRHCEMTQFHVMTMPMKPTIHQYFVTFFENRLGKHWNHYGKPIPTQWHILTCLGKKPFQNIVGKGENAGNQHFHLFPQCFLHYQRQKLSFMLQLFCRLQLL